MRPFTLLIKPAGPDCNIACRYCFYTAKTRLFAAGKHRMSDEVREKLIADYLKLRLPVSAFAWQGGEPTLMGLDFYQKMVAEQKKFGADGQVISNSLQTNALHLDDEWCDFLREYNWLVGISLDGPQRFHDYYRRDNAGRGTYDRVIASLESCRRRRVQFNILTLLNDQNVGFPNELFDFFVDMRIKYLQFIPCLEKNPACGSITDYSITAPQYGDFLCRIFDRWWEFGPEKISMRILDSLLSYMVQGRHTDCTFGRRCGDYIVIEHNGDAFCCDFFVDKDYRLGNILETPLAQLFQGQIKDRFARQKRKISNLCLICRHHALCRGGCLKDRIVPDGDFAAPSYFCSAYQQFFDYALPRLSQVAARVAQISV